MRLPSTFCIALACGALALSADTVAAAPQHAHLDRAIRQALQNGAPTQHVIITFNPGCRDAWRNALQQHGDVVSGDHPLIDALSGEIHSQDVDALAQDACVKSIASDAPVHADGRPAGKGAARGPRSLGGSTAQISQNTQLSQTMMSTLRDTLGLPHYAALDPEVPTGDGGIGVAVIDSGIAPSADFTGRITSFWDFTQPGPVFPTSPYDDFGHGTHIAGLIGSSGVLSNYEFQGVAPAVNLVGLKVLDGTGQGKTSDVIRALEFVIKNKSALGVQVINLSLGHPILSAAADDPLVQTVEKASAAGLVVVVSAGNFGEKQSDGSVGYMGITSPGNAPSAITVGAAMTADTVSRFDDVVAPYSSRGPTWFDAFPKPDVVAPGHQLASDTNLSSYLYTLLAQNHANATTGQPLLELSGSSMATAVTTGVVALILDAHSENGLNRLKPLTPNLVKGILEFSAIPIEGADLLSEGAGEINAAGAIELAEHIDTAKTTGMTWLRNVVPSSLIGAVSYGWSQQVIYGDTVLGGAVISANNIVWSTNIVWGTSVAWPRGVEIDAANIVWGTNIVWGANIVWGNLVIGEKIDAKNIVWGTNIVWGALTAKNIVWGMMVDGDSENIVWGTSVDGDGDNIVWGASLVGGIS
jgi:serine protease AprX